MVTRFCRAIHKTVLWCWQKAAGRPSNPPASAPLPAEPGVRWTIASHTLAGALDPSDPIQKELAKNRDRFLRGGLTAPLADLARKGVIVAACIDETGAIQARHTVATFPDPT